MFREIVQGFLRMGAAAASVALLAGNGLTCHAETIAFTGFEEAGDSGETWLGVSISGTGGAFSTATGSGDSPASQRILSGLRSFQANAPGTVNAICTVDFDTIDVSAYDTIQLTIRVSSTTSGTSNGSDLGDQVKLYLALNGAAFSATPDITLTGNSNARWGFNAPGIVSTAAGTPVTQAGTTATGYSTLIITIPNSATSVDFRIVANNDNSGEFWNIDNVSLTGTAIPEPSTAVALVGGLGMLCGFRRLRRGSVSGLS